MSSIKIELSGLEKVKKAIRDVPKNSATQIAEQLNAFGFDTVRDAQTFAPTDEAHLKNSISYIKATARNLVVEVVVATNYAAYLEFGTRSFAAAYVSTLPANWQAFAKEYKGPAGSGSLEEMLLRIMEWVRRKGIAGTYSVKTKRRTGNKGARDFEDAEAAYPIALAILRKGIRAHPFLYPAVTKNKELLVNRLNSLFK